MPASVIPRTNPVTLAHLERRLLARLTTDFIKEDDGFYREQFREWLAEAYVELNREMALLCEALQYDIGPSTYAFNLPNNILDQMVLDRGVIVWPEGRTGVKVFPTRKTWEEMVLRYGDFSNPLGSYGAVHWSVSPINIPVDGAEPGQFVVMYPSEETVSEGMELHYVVHPGQFEPVRESEDLGITASVENGSRTVLLSAWPDDGVARDLAFGVRASATDMPTKWYRTYTSDENTLTFELDHDYEGATGASKNFTLSPVSPLEWRRPGLIMNAPIEYALWQHRLQQDGDGPADVQQARWEMAKAKIRAAASDAQGLELRGVNRRRLHPGLRSRF